MSNTHDAPQRRQGERGWVEPEDEEIHIWDNLWLATAIVFWVVGIAAAVMQQWALSATGLIAGSVAAVRSK